MNVPSTPPDSGAGEGLKDAEDGRGAGEEPKGEGGRGAGEPRGAEGATGGVADVTRRRKIIQWFSAHKSTIRAFVITALVGISIYSTCSIVVEVCELKIEKYELRLSIAVGAFLIAVGIEFFKYLERLGKAMEDSPAKSLTILELINTLRQEKRNHQYASWWALNFAYTLLASSLVVFAINIGSFAFSAENLGRYVVLSILFTFVYSMLRVYWFARRMAAHAADRADALWALVAILSDSQTKAAMAATSTNPASSGPQPSTTQILPALTIQSLIADLKGFFDTTYIDRIRPGTLPPNWQQQLRDIAMSQTESGKTK